MYHKKRCFFLLIIVLSALQMLLPIISNAATPKAFDSHVLVPPTVKFTKESLNMIGGHEQLKVKLTIYNTITNCPIQYTLGFDTKKLKLADKTINIPLATTSPVRGVIWNEPLYNPNDDSGWLEPLGYQLDNVHGKLDYMISISENVKGRPPVDDNFDIKVDSKGLTIQTLTFQVADGAILDNNSLYLISDSDGDGVLDKDEIAAGTNPYDSKSKPAKGPIDKRVNLSNPTGIILPYHDKKENTIISFDSPTLVAFNIASSNTAMNNSKTNSASMLNSSKNPSANHDNKITTSAPSTNTAKSQNTNSNLKSNINKNTSQNAVSYQNKLNEKSNTQNKTPFEFNYLLIISSIICLIAIICFIIILIHTKNKKFKV